MSKNMAPYPYTKRFNHICKGMRIAHPENFIDLLGVDGSARWTMRVASEEFQVFHCPFCGRDLNQVYSLWSSKNLWSVKERTNNNE